MYDRLNTVASREADRQWLAQKMAAFDGQPVELPGYTQKPMPIRRRWVDPETKLKRKKCSTVTFKKLANDQEKS